MTKIILALMVSLACLPAEARQFYTSEYRITLYYSNFDVPQTAVAQSLGVFRVTNDDEFPHLLARQKDGATIRYDLISGGISLRYSTDKNYSSMVAFKIGAEPMRDLLDRALTAGGPHEAAARKLLSRYATAKNFGLSYSESDKRTDSTFPYSEYYQFHDEQSEEALHVWVEVSDKVIRNR